MAVNRNVARGEVTRVHLVEVATELFATRGFEATSIDAVLEAAGVSRGSLYHHFANKEALFEAVAESVEAEVTARLLEGDALVADPVEGLKAGARAWVRVAREPRVRQILLIDAPAVMGWARWRAMEERHGLGLIKGALQLIAEAGQLDASLVDLFAHVLMAASNEVVLYIATADDPDRAMAEGEAVLEELLTRLL